MKLWRRILVTGDRNWLDIDVIQKTLQKEEGPNIILIHGDARGADRLSGIVATARGWQVRPVKADWLLLGHAAGPIRNRKMLDMSPQYVYAFHNNIRNSKGTKDCVLEALRRGIPGEIIGKDGEVKDKW